MNIKKPKKNFSTTNLPPTTLFTPKMKNET